MVLTEEDGDFLGWLHGAGGPGVELRHKQHRLVDKGAEKGDLARIFVAAKIVSMRTGLLRAVRGTALVAESEASLNGGPRALSNLERDHPAQQLRRNGLVVGELDRALAGVEIGEVDAERVAVYATVCCPPPVRAKLTGARPGPRRSRWRVIASRCCQMSTSRTAPPVVDESSRRVGT